MGLFQQRHKCPHRAGAAGSRLCPAPGVGTGWVLMAPILFPIWAHFAGVWREGCLGRPLGCGRGTWPGGPRPSQGVRHGSQLLPYTRPSAARGVPQAARSGQHPGVAASSSESKLKPEPRCPVPPSPLLPPPLGSWVLSLFLVCVRACRCSGSTPPAASAAMTSRAARCGCTSSEASTSRACSCR